MNSGIANLSPYASCKLTEEQVLFVLTSALTNRQVADELDVSPSTVQKIRQGETWTHVLPDVPRPGRGVKRIGPSCRDCVHYLHDACSLGFPEFKEIGSRAARYCVPYRSALS
jgi:hypothetical protein